MVNRANVRALLVHLYDKMPEGAKGGTSQLASFAASFDAELGGTATAPGMGVSGAAARSNDSAKTDGSTDPLQVIAAAKEKEGDAGSASVASAEPVAWRSLTVLRPDQRELASQSAATPPKDEAAEATSKEASEQAEMTDLHGAEAKAHKSRVHGDGVEVPEDATTTAVATNTGADESATTAVQIAATQRVDQTPQVAIAAVKAGEDGVQAASAKTVTAARQAARATQGSGAAQGAIARQDSLATETETTEVEQSGVEASTATSRDRPALRVAARAFRDPLQGPSLHANAAGGDDAMVRSQAVGRAAARDGAQSGRGSEHGAAGASGTSDGSKAAVQEPSWAGQHAAGIEGQAAGGSAGSVSGMHVAVQATAGGAHATGSGSDARTTGVREELRELGSSVLHATQESAADRTVTATPSSLEVGVAQGGHGWLKVRAEMTDAGTVTAQLASSTAAGTQALHRDLPALSGFLEREQVPVSSLVVQAPEQSGLSSGADGGGRAGRQDASGQQGGQPEQETRREQGVGREEPDPASWETPSLGGGWLSVRA